ncbi:MAG TPA: molybdenum cofactor biosynthesis protein [Sphaerochaeta sp.]|nr:molybdenum cofactor biosynthesis protein [Sphaerochaeta sp.]HCS37484.1 molybdenum cofactor biosynthesis protein [Sphaerochaeta sp.]
MFAVAIVTLSDSGYAGRREDLSGPIIEELCRTDGFRISHTILLPDDKEMISAELRKICDNHLADLIITTGGTGFSPRDWTPEATSAVADRFVPGISEFLRSSVMPRMKRAMLSRGVSVIRKQTLIVNLPGNPNAVRENMEYLLPVLPHGLEILTGIAGDCANT